VERIGRPFGSHDRQVGQRGHVGRSAGQVPASDAGIQACEWFGLRDGLTTAAWSARFGILRDDYTPKSAFTTLQHLIATASMR
jgi:hypothetical protein